MYSQTCLERSVRSEATFCFKATWSKCFVVVYNKCYLRFKATCLLWPLSWCKRGGLSRVKTGLIVYSESKNIVLCNDISYSRNTYVFLVTAMFVSTVHFWTEAFVEKWLDGKRYSHVCIGYCPQMTWVAQCHNQSILGVISQDQLWPVLTMLRTSVNTFDKCY